MKLHLSLAVLSVLMAGAPAKAGGGWDEVYPIYRITEEGGGLGIFVDSVIVVTRPEDGRWVGERWRRDDVLGKTKRVHDWIDSRACPWLLEVLASLSTLPKNGVLPPDRAKSQSLAFDVKTVSVKGPASVHGETRIKWTQFLFGKLRCGGSPGRAGATAGNERSRPRRARWSAAAFIRFRR